MGSDEDQLQNITIYLKRLSAGDSTAESPLAEAVYGQMQRIARKMLSDQRAHCSVEATGLVNEVLLELVRLRSLEWQDRSHFFRMAARLLRRRFIDHIRASRALKRPPKKAQVDCLDLFLPAEERFDEIILVDEGLERLASFDPALVELVEMIYFGGVPISAVAEIRGVSEKTVDRHLDLARRWLKLSFAGSCPSFPPRPPSSN